MSSSKKSKGVGKGKDNKGKDKGKGKKTSDDMPANFNTLQRPTKPRAAKKVLIIDKKDDELPTYQKDDKLLTYNTLQQPSDTAFPYTACGEVVKKVPKVPTYAICKFTAFISNFLQSFSSC